MLNVTHKCSIGAKSDGHDFLVASPEGEVRSIVMSMSVCLSPKGRTSSFCHVTHMGTLKSRKTRQWKSRHQNARVEIAGEDKVWKVNVLKKYF